MNQLIPLIVIVPLIAALFLNLFAGKNKTIKVLAFIVGLGLPILTLTTSYGLHYFGGHQPLALSNIANLSSYITNSSLYDLLSNLFFIFLINLSFPCRKFSHVLL